MTKLPTTSYLLLALALTILFSCADDYERDNPNDPKAGNYVGNGGSSSDDVSSSLRSSSAISLSSSSTGKGNSSSSSLNRSSSAGSSSSIGQGNSSSSVVSSSGFIASSSSAGSSSSITLSSSSAIGGGLCEGFNPNAEVEHYSQMKKQLCDSRDGKKYVYVKIGDQTWMAENLNFNASGSVCYSNNTANCTTYGRLYGWAAAMGLGSNYNIEQYGTENCEDIDVSDGTLEYCSPAIFHYKGICPQGWHLPSRNEWAQLIDYVKSDNGNDSEVYKYLIAQKEVFSYYPNIKDTYGFSLLMGGYRNEGDNFVSYETGDIFWSTFDTEKIWGFQHGSALALHVILIDYTELKTTFKNSMLGVRCVEN
jgi:uncharacterized protein (TIGR02145 family)